MFPCVTLIHGINGSQREMRNLAQLFGPHADVLNLNLSGHGGRPISEAFSVPRWAADVLAQLDAAGVTRTVLVGYSLGGYVALYLARHHPERVAGVLTLATKHVLDQRYTRITTFLANPERFADQPEAATAEFREHHQPQDWRAVMRANRQFFQDLSIGPPLSGADFQAIRCPVLIINGAHDPVVSLGESEALARLLPSARGLWYRGSAHPMQAVPLTDLAPHILRWFQELEQPVPVCPG